MICFQICTFEPLETTDITKATGQHMLWFAFKFVPLNHWKQRSRETETASQGCDLLSNLYLWTIGNNARPLMGFSLNVVICFQICTFEPLETTRLYIYPFLTLLWFAFKFVPLNHWKQRANDKHITTLGCDLLSNLYLWTIGNNKQQIHKEQLHVVICFQICTFEPLETTYSVVTIRGSAVVICFQICTFEPLETTKLPTPFNTSSCDLLSNLYLWTIGNN